MNNFWFIQFLLQGLCLLTIQRGNTARSNKCNTPKLGKTDTLLITMFDNQNSFTAAMWDNLCKAVKQFPQGLIKMEYRAGALATGSVDNMTCGGKNCDDDQVQECYLMHSKNYDSCWGPTIEVYPDVLRCYCKGESKEALLKNGNIRASWNVPESVVPTYGVNQAYDACFKFGSYEDILNYFCKVYQKQVGNCGQK